jgi:ketosteroid isomerase-like protein
MSQENVELAYRLTDAFNRRDLDAYLDLTDEDVEAIPRTGAMEGSYHGHDGTRQWWTDLLGSFPDFSVESYEVHDKWGNLTLAAARARAHGAGSDTPIEQVFWQVVRWRRGRCFWWAHFDTRAEALEAVGLSEQDAHADS